ncbi:unnamed protein product [Adineta ricciae]|uniref:Homeobox domain-containing protein n=1 Tax=Adineta ricciae TaxID=249248 RepID=A0A813QYB0_ADIRI|nr:unnamed protein product [Adineta ricciae]CAF1026294.1 unnamed protein product [Adineta ricciae]
MVQSLCENKRFCQLICQLRKNNNKSSISKALVDASRSLLNENTHALQRRRFTLSQLERLENTFAHSRYLNRQECSVLVQDLQIERYKIQQWFARRRMKFKQELRNTIALPALPVLPPVLLASVAA